MKDATPFKVVVSVSVFFFALSCPLLTTSFHFAPSSMFSESIW